MPRAVEELMRWCGPQLLTFPRHAREDTEFHGVPIARGRRGGRRRRRRQPRPACLRRPRPARRHAAAPGRAGHLGFAHGPHFCLGAGLARVQTEVALTALLAASPASRRPAEQVRYVPDPATWRLAALPVRL